MNKVKNGTPDHALDLCRSCESSAFVQGMTLSQSFKYCHTFNREVGFTVSQCSGYRNMSLARSGEFYKTAWVLVPTGTFQGKALDPGSMKRDSFKGVPPEEYRRKQRTGEVE